MDEKMNIKEMIEKYNIAPETKDFGETYTGRLLVRNTKAMKRDHAENLLREKKPEIMAYFEQEKAKKEDEKKDRERRIAGIEGLEELKKAYKELAEWRIKFYSSFDGEDAVGGMGVGEEPTHDVEALSKKYPRASAYLKAREYTLMTNTELSKIGQKAVEEVIYGDYQKAMDDMEKETKKFAERHIWD